MSNILVADSKRVSEYTSIMIRQAGFDIDNAERGFLR